ncbi:MAG TPA: triose-phosphate isomerase [Mycobacteriales bacterium]|jgi:triosephosphate isomerase|nr:triose-phosphate isomerase [Mycobacteriales bacterium]
MVAGNWKMHLTHLEAIAHAQQVAYSLKAPVLAAVETVVLPPFTALRSVQTLIDGERLALEYGAQDLAVDPDGAHTGDVSGPMLAALGCRYVVVGHSERRADHGEDDELVRRKVAAAFRHALTPILCVGEDLAVRESGQHLAHVLAQLDAALQGLPNADAERLVVAYEPIWAIGTGRTATPEDAQQMAGALRTRLVERFDGGLADGIRLLYGGSVKPDNADALFEGDDVDGALVGGASLDAQAFTAIVRAAGAAV